MKNRPTLSRDLAAFMIAAVWTTMTTVPLRGQEIDPVPVIEFTPGLPGTQVRLSWHAEPGARYVIEKSPDLSPGSWKRLALVEPTQADAVWLDPVMVTERFFYRVTKPQAEVFSIESPALSEAGGRFVISGQALPSGSSLLLETQGGDPQFFTLVQQGNGTWHADITGSYALDAVLTARVRFREQTIGPVFHPVVTANGLMPDSPASLPPAAPVSPVDGGKPIPGIGIVVKRNSSALARTGGPLYTGDNTPVIKGSALGSLRGTPTKLGGDCQDAGTRAVFRSGNPLYDSQGRNGNNPIYQGRSQSNPAFQQNGMAGEMPSLHSPLDTGLPGEVGFHACDLALATPAGPPLAWVRTYRSKGGTSPTGTTFSYDISIEPIPAADGAAATRVRIHDGAGRADVFHRQPDGSFTCDGMFREGRFDGETFTLTFFDQGRWEFHPFDGSSTAGKISFIIDVHGNALTCGYDSSGRLTSVAWLGNDLLCLGPDRTRSRRFITACRGWLTGALRCNRTTRRSSAVSCGCMRNFDSSCRSLHDSPFGLRLRLRP